MSDPLRKLRGVIGIGLTWVTLWAALFALLVAVTAVIDPDSVDPGEGPIVAGPTPGVHGPMPSMTLPEERE